MTIFERQGRDENLERYFEMAVGRAWLGWLPPAGNRISLLQIPQTHKKNHTFKFAFFWLVTRFPWKNPRGRRGSRGRGGFQNFYLCSLWIAPKGDCAEPPSWTDTKSYLWCTRNWSISALFVVVSTKGIGVISVVWFHLNIKLSF